MPSDNGESTYCNARLKGNGDLEKRDPGEWAGEGYCKHPTDGGRCRMHGGTEDIGRPVETGLHSELRENLREYVVQAAEKDAPGDLRDELAVVRGLLYRRLSEAEGLDSDLVDDAHKLLSELRRYSDTIHKQLQRERLTKEEEQQLFTTFAKILREYVPDADRDDALDELEAIAAGGGRRALEGEF